jgi:hypothetical protein
MSAARIRILEMLSSGQITTDEAEALLLALRRPRTSLWQWIVHPLEKLQARQALLAAGVFALLQLAISLFLYVRFDGALDVHPTLAPISWVAALLDLGVALPMPAVVFLVAARLVGKQGRWIDCLSAVGIARLPLLLAGAMAGGLRETLHGVQEGGAGLLVIAFSVLSLVLLAWFLTLLVTGLRAVSDLRGGKLALTSVGAVLVAEVASKAALSLLS